MRLKEMILHVRQPSVFLVWGILLLFALVCPAQSAGNAYNESFDKAKKFLEQQVYFDHRVTIYCSASYDAKKNIDTPEGFTTSKYIDRAKKVEWEHIVPAENFGRNFTEWTVGDPDVCTKSGKAYKGRECAEKANQEYRYMQADMHNLAPAIGAVNAARQNYNFVIFPAEVESDFGSCKFKVSNKLAEAPEASRGIIARTHLYMQSEYPRFKMDDSQYLQMQVWNEVYPPNQWECTRAQRIAKIQGNANTITEDACQAAGF